MALRLIDLEAPELPAAQPIDTSAMEVDMGDQAGLQPLPLGRMFRQAGRPMSPRSRGQHLDNIYGRNRSVEVNPALHDLTIQRNQRNQQVIENWDPIGAENKQRLNNTNPNPRSKPSAPSAGTSLKFLQKLGDTADFRRTKAFQAAYHDDPMWGATGQKFREASDQRYDTEAKTDASLFLTSQERAAVKSMVFDHLDARAGDKAKLGKDHLPLGLNSRFPKLSNDLLYEWNARRARQLREGTLDMLEISRDTIRGI